MGINPPVRSSGDLEGSENLILYNSEKELLVKECCIIANRHIHIKNEDLLKYNLKDKQLVKVKVDGQKGGILDNILVRASENAFFELHIDTDDANAFLISQNDCVEIINEN